MDGLELYKQRDDIKKNLYRSMENMYQNGKNYAETTRDYRIKLAQMILRLRDSGYPVSIIDKVAKGQEQIAEAEYNMNVAEVLYKSAQENIMIQKKLLDSVEEEIRREYGRSD